MTFPTFAEFFTALTDHGPYGWQHDLADYLQEHGRWPWHIDVPTGLGKTSCIDIAVYELARQVHHGERRTAPQRIFHVVDRRTIIDSAVEHARVLAERIAGADSGPLSVVREALTTLRPAGSDEVIHVTGIHGQDSDDLQWMHRVTGCTIVSLTSHQFVSRLLFRGYGVSEATRPIAAALSAIDRLVLFDEPHLSTQAVHTILAAERLQARAREDLGLPCSTTTLLGATVPTYLTALGDTTLRIRADRPLDAARERLEARRPTRVDWLEGSNDRTLASSLASAARAVVESGAERTVVFTNTVGMAQEVYRALKGTTTASGSPLPLRLATSRFRPWDKAQMNFDGPVLVVATQTLEVGVDLSFDGLVTELCPWASLLQRLGRFNRYGERNTDKEFARRPAVVVAGWNGENDAPYLRLASTSVYGAEQLEACARLLRDVTAHAATGSIDLGPSALRRLDVEDGLLEAPAPRVGTLTSAMLPLLAQTMPTPEADVPLDALISGPDAPASAEIQVVWRDNLAVFDISRLNPRVSTREIVAVPPSAWRAFLSGGASFSADATADIDVATERRATLPRSLDLERFRVWSPTTSEWVVPSSVQALARAKRVILDSALGGYTPTLGWTGTPTAKGDTIQPSLDISRQAALVDIGHLRFGTRVDLVIQGEHLRAEVEEASASASNDLNNLLDAVQAALDLATSGVPAEEIDATDILELTPVYVRSLLSARTQPHRDSARSESPGAELDIKVLPAINAQVIIVRVQLLPLRPGNTINLDVHQEQVGAWAGQDATTLNLSAELVRQAAFAGRRHDEGKTAEFCQRQFHGCDPTGMSTLAKSVRPPASRAANRTQRAEAGVPHHWRHEAESLSSIPTAPTLVRHLVASHHGWFRPIMPPTSYATDHDGYPMPAEHADDFEQLNDRLGVWGLAFLEALVRMADWRASATPQDLSPGSPLLSALSHETARPITSGPTPRPRRTHVLTGLHSHPMTGWFSAVGLLAAATETDRGAQLHWEPLPSDATGTPLVPVLTTSDDTEVLVRRLVQSVCWRPSLELAADHLTKSLDAKSQKVAPSSALHALLTTADAREEWLLLGLVNDLNATETAEQIALAIAPFANNASYVKVATTRVDLGRGLADGAVSEIVSALTTLSAGFAAVKCDGGMDRSLSHVPGVNGLGDPVTRLSRSALAPLALYGMASLGAGPLRGIGVTAAGDVVLPLPTAGQTFAQLRALTYLGRGRSRWNWASTGLEWIYVADQHHPTDKESVWIGRPCQRS